MSNHINDGDVKMKRKKNNTVFYMLSKTKQQDAVISAQKGSYLTASAMPRRNRIGSLETSNHQLGWWWKKLIAIKILQ